MVTLLFSKRKHPGSWLIRIASWSEWSHVEIVFPDGRLLGASAPHGVCVTQIDDRIAMSSGVAMMDFPGDFEAGLNWAEGQIGKPYDYIGVLGLGLHRDWEEDDKWWCSEFAGRFLKESGFAPYRSDAMKRLTPQHLFMLNQHFSIIK